MATNVDSGASPPSPVTRDSSPYPTDFKMWKILAWTGPVFLFAVFVLWGIVARNMPPFPPQRDARRGQGALHRARGFRC